MSCVLDIVHCPTWKLTCCWVGHGRECCARLLKQEYEKKVSELKVAAVGNAGGREGVIHIDDDEVISAISSAYFPTEKTEFYLTADQRRKNELSSLSETYQEHLHTLDEVFDKASAPDRPGEVSRLVFMLLCPV